MTPSVSPSECDSSETGGSVKTSNPQTPDGWEFGLKPRTPKFLLLKKFPDTDKLRRKFCNDGWFCIGMQMIDGTRYMHFHKKDNRNDF